MYLWYLITENNHTNTLIEDSKMNLICFTSQKIFTIYNNRQYILRFFLSVYSRALEYVIERGIA